MGEARRRNSKGLKELSSNKPINSHNRIISWLPISIDQREQFFAITKLGAWIGIGILVVFWIVVRVIGPAFGWWTPADIH
tara:strand:+ start:21 stop:260 length:240 start_codon:yes stop_codon:yes gene_type:complete